MKWTGARYADSPTVQVTAWVDAPPSLVWAEATDVSAMAEASPELQASEWLDDGPRLGARFVGRNRHESLGEWSTTCYVVECEEERVFGWAVEDPRVPTATWRFTLEPADGGTRLTQWARMGPARSGLSRAIDAMPDKEQKIVFVRLREFEAGMTATVAAIKDRAERASRAG
jgi:hypothetical protein